MLQLYGKSRRVNEYIHAANLGGSPNPSEPSVLMWFHFQCSSDIEFQQVYRHYLISYVQLFIELTHLVLVPAAEKYNWTALCHSFLTAWAFIWGWSSVLGVVILSVRPSIRLVVTCVDWSLCMLSALPNDVVSKIQCQQLHNERFGCRHSTLQSHGLFALAKPLLHLSPYVSSLC